MFSVLCIGRFGWALIDKTYVVPYIKRIIDNKPIKYIAVRIIESYLISEYIHFIHPAIYVHLSVNSLPLTKAEAKIYNLINIFHCDNKFGNTEFRERKDFIIELKDGIEVYLYFKACFKKLNNEGFIPRQRFGFIRTEPFSLLPYVNVNGKKYVPYMFLKGDKTNINIPTLVIKDWDLKYLKFLFIALGINSHFYINFESFMVVNIDSVKNCLPNIIKYKEYWPQDFGEISHLISKTTFGVNVQSPWIKKSLNTRSLDDEEDNVQIREWRSIPTIPKEFFINDVGLYDILVCTK